MQKTGYAFYHKFKPQLKQYSQEIHSFESIQQKTKNTEKMNSEGGWKKQQYSKSNETRRKAIIR